MLHPFLFGLPIKSNWQLSKSESQESMICKMPLGLGENKHFVTLLVKNDQNWYEINWYDLNYELKWINKYIFKGEGPLGIATRRWQSSWTTRSRGGRGGRNKITSENFTNLDIIHAGLNLLCQTENFIQI